MPAHRLTGALVAAALAASAGQADTFVCRFTEACIDGRACFDSAAEAQVAEIGEGRAVLAFEGRRLPARVRQEGVWRSYRTAPDIDLADRVVVLDTRPDGQAVLVVSQPGQAASVVSREGTCQPREGSP